MRLILDAIYLLAGAAFTPCLLYRMARHSRYRIGWANRFGKIKRKNPDKKCIWIHAVSVGEVNATKTIVEELKNKFADYEIVISTTTDTGFARASALYGDSLQVFFFPLDISWIMARAFRNINPDLCLLMELEVWPNFVDLAGEQNVPVVVVNGRISEKSFSRYKLIKPLVESVFKKVTLSLAQTDEYAQRFKYLGCPDEKVIVTGSLKYDTAQITDKVDGADALAKELNIENEKLLVAGGTGNDEEKLLLQVYRKLCDTKKNLDLRLIIVPRKPERFDEVADLIKQTGFGFIRYSEYKAKDSCPKSDSQTVILGDTMGDLRKFYSLASLIFVGRSLVPMGGSDMAEAAALGKCTIFGPHAFNFKQTVNALLAGEGAIIVNDKEELLKTIAKCLDEPDFAQKIAQNGQNVIKQNQGATQKTITQIEKLLEHFK